MAAVNGSTVAEGTHPAARSACDGLRVLDLSTGPAGGIATMILADFGADVVKIEPPGGDPSRVEPSAQVWLRGKRSVELDLRSAEGRARLHGLARDADVVVSSFRPGSAEPLGADVETLRELNPRLVYCSVTGWGPRGPLARVPGYDAAVAAKSGYMMTFVGQLEGERPVFSAVPIGQHAAAHTALRGILAALIARDRSGVGQLVETSLLQGMIPVDTAGLAITQLRDRRPEEFPPPDRPLFGGQPNIGYHPVPTRDGRWFQLAGLRDRFFNAFISAVELDQEYSPPEFAGGRRAWSASQTEQVRDLIARRMLERDESEWTHRFLESDNVAAELWRSPREALDHPQLLHNGDIITVESPELGPIRQVGPVARLTATPAHPPSPPPRVGERGESGWRARSAGGVPAWTPSPSEHSRGPLDGVTVLEFASVVAAPFGCALLAELGARLIKVEPLEGERSRTSPNPGVGSARAGLGGIKVTSDKESICLDLKSSEGMRVAHELIARADVLVHNYRPGVPERLGIGYERSRELNDQIVYVAALGYGSDGPYAHRPTAAPGVGAAMGGAYMQAGGALPPGDADDLPATHATSRQLMWATPGSADYNASQVIADSAVLGLYARARLGVGQLVECNMLLANAYTNMSVCLDYAGAPPPPASGPSLLGPDALYRLYEARSGWIFLACRREREWRAFARAAGRDELATDPRFKDREARARHDTELAEVLEALFAERDADDWEEALVAAEVACVRADAYVPGSFWYGHPHVRDNDFVIEVGHPAFGSYLRHAALASFGGTPVTVGRQVLAGEQTRAILDELGHAPEEIESLLSQGVVAASKHAPSLR